MAIPKRKNNIDVYNDGATTYGQDIQNNRQRLLDNITKSDTYLPDSVLHDDLDKGMLEYVKKNFVVVSDGERIPVIEKILTIQRWGEFSNNWNFSDDDGNIKLPFIAVIRKPDVQPGTNPSVQRTIPDRKTFYYQSVPTWDGNKKGADIYKIPQPVAIDITYEVVFVCNKFQDTNLFNKIIMQKFSSRQSYTLVKGHYIPIILQSNDDSTPMETIDGRRFYIQNYKFIMLGLLVDKEEFEVKPAMSRFLLMTEFIQDKNYKKKFESKDINVKTVSFTANGTDTVFSVGESISELLNVGINGLIQEKDVDYYHIGGTSKITFTTPPQEGSNITIVYYKSKSFSNFIDNYGKVVNLNKQYFVYDGSSVSFTTISPITYIVTVDINGLVEEIDNGYSITGTSEFTFNYTPVIGSKIGIVYFS
jgi:hypothetical protein